MRDAAKGNFLPWNVCFSKQGGFEAFNARRVVAVKHSPAVKEVNLIDVRNVDQRKKRVDLHLRTGFFECLALRCLYGGFAVFHEAGGQGPVSVAWFDGAAAKQDFALPFGNAAVNELGVQVVNRLAAWANMARQ